MFKLIFIPKKFHDDVVLITKQNRYAVTIDSYYFVISPDTKYENQNGYGKVGAVLYDVFEYWLKVISEGNGFLPFDFSDQYLGGFDVRESNAVVSLRYGIYRDINIIAEDISNVLEIDYKQYDFDADSDFRELFLNKADLLDSVKKLQDVVLRFMQGHI